MKVNTEKCEVFFIDIKEFKDKFYNNNAAFKQLLCEKLELQELLHDELKKRRQLNSKQKIKTRIRIKLKSKYRH